MLVILFGFCSEDMVYREDIKREINYKKVV